MNEIVEKAIRLRELGEYDKCRDMLYPLIHSPGLKARGHLHIAWSYDNQGFEKEAIEHYQQAIKGKLEESERFHALFGLACTLRSVGEYSKAYHCFNNILEEYPNALEVLPFYAMTLYNIGEGKTAVEILLNLVADTTLSKDIIAYRKAIKLYAQDVSRKW